MTGEAAARLGEALASAHPELLTAVELVGAEAIAGINQVVAKTPVPAAGIPPFVDPSLHQLRD